MVAHGVTRARLPSDNEVICTLADPRVAALAKEMGTTRTAAAMEFWRPQLAGAVVAFGNAPTALFHLLEMLDAGAPRPALILAMPVGFVGAAESKEAAIADGRVPGDRDARAQGRQRHGGGGDQCAGERKGMSRQLEKIGRLYGVGLGPGDPELADGEGGAGDRDDAGHRLFRQGLVGAAMRAPSPIAGFPSSAEEMPLHYPVTTEIPVTDPAYNRQLAAFYEDAADAIAAKLACGRDVAILSEGDPLVLWLLHASLHPAEGALRCHHRAGRHRHGRLLVGGGRADDLGRRRADGVARNPAA